MNIVYVAPMFHTNQVPIVKGWLEHGDQVAFICQYKGRTENHQYCTPYVLGYSGLFRLILSVHSFFHKKSRKHLAYPEAFKDKCGFPPMGKLYRYLKKQRPDLVILRERSMYSIFTYFICQILKINCILYNQTPLWDNEPPRNDFAHKVVKTLTPSIRMTPVFGNPETGYLDKNAVYVPFVITPAQAPEHKSYFLNGQIHLLCVGKFEERKNHLMLLQILNELLPAYPLHLTLVGEVSTPYHENYFKKLQAYISTQHLESFVTCHTNCNPKDMAEFYRAADLFILPSTGEFASVSQLEAMSYSLPVIVSNTNGTSCYVEEGRNGYLFADNDASDLKEKITSMITDKNNILQMGTHSYHLVVEKYAFTNYLKEISRFIPRQNA